MIIDILEKKQKKRPVDTSLATKSIPDGIVHKCEKCGVLERAKKLEQNLKVCSHCGYHHPMSAPERIRSLVDPDSFVEYDHDLISDDPLSFPSYAEKLKQDREKSKLNEAIITGEGRIKGIPVILGVMDSRFRMGSMGSVVGEKIARAINKAIQKRLPFILFAASGGARMQEGVLSLMQMAKTSASLQLLHQERLLFISVLTHPTTGGVSASFASLGDINIAEPGALIGFAGRRVIEQTVRQKLPDDFQTAEFLLKHGQLDLVVTRTKMKETLFQLLMHHTNRSEYIDDCTYAI
jgi:acetyl-CoA carboxylase carboxyl transferase subunit beta